MILILSQFKYLRTRVATDASPNSKAGADELMRHLGSGSKAGKRGSFLVPLSFVHFGPSKD